MNKIEQLSESRLLSLLMTFFGIGKNFSIFGTNSADPWLPWPWP